MKNLLLVVIFLFVGFGAVLLYKVQTDIATEEKETQKMEIPTAFSLEKAPSTTLFGNIESMSGNVGWESRVATEPARITAPQRVGQGEALETKEDGMVTIIFPNVGVIKLLPKTFIGIIQTLPAQVVLAQTKGNAVYKKEGTVPLSVDVANLLIKINNGQISVNVNDTRLLITGDSAAGSSATLAYVDINNQSNVATVKNGQGFTFNTQTKRLSIAP